MDNVVIGAGRCEIVNLICSMSSSFSVQFFPVSLVSPIYSRSSSFSVLS